MNISDCTRVILIDSPDPWSLSAPSIPRIHVLPLGLVYLGSSLKREFQDKVQVRIIDPSMLSNPDEDTLGEIAAFAPHVVGIRSIGGNTEFASRILSAAPAAAPGAVLLVGGSSTSTYLERLLPQTGPPVIAVIGEGEKTIVEVVRRLRSVWRYDGLPGTAVIEKGKVSHTPGRKFLEDLDSITSPDWGLVSLEEYGAKMNLGCHRGKHAFLLTSRGCPYKCIYCSRMSGCLFRARSPQAVMEEIYQLYHQHSVRNFHVMDDNFTIDQQRAEEIMDLIIASKLKLRLYFTVGLRPDTLTTGLVEKMIQAGMVWISYAVETGSPRLQRLINKNLNLEKAREIINYTWDRGIMVNYFLMTGLPTETCEEAMETIAFAGMLKPFAVPNLFQAKYYQGTEMHRMAREAGFDMGSLEQAALAPYFDLRNGGTPTMSRSDMAKINYSFKRNLLLNRKRLEAGMERQLKFHSPEDVVSTYSIVMGRPFESLQEVLACAGEDGTAGAGRPLAGMG
jgi:hypothetical protein